MPTVNIFNLPTDCDHDKFSILGPGKWDCASCGSTIIIKENQISNICSTIEDNNQALYLANIRADKAEVRADKAEAKLLEVKLNLLKALDLINEYDKAIEFAKNWLHDSSFWDSEPEIIKRFQPLYDKHYEIKISIKE